MLLVGLISERFFEKELAPFTRILFLSSLTLCAFTPKAIITLWVLMIMKAAAALIPAPQDANTMYRAFYENDLDVINGPFLNGLAFYSGKQIEHLLENLGPPPSRPMDSLWNEGSRR